MIAWTVLSILGLLSLCFAKQAQEKSYREVFKCNLKFISKVEAQKAVELGCSQMEFAPPTNHFPASFIESELFDLINVVLFSWPVFLFANVLRVSDDYGLNRVVFDSSCRLVGLIHIKPTGPEPCLHLIEAEDLRIANNLVIYNTPWNNLPVYGYKFQDEIYLQNVVEEFVKSNFHQFHDDTKKKHILDPYPSDVSNANTRIMTRTIKLGPRGIEIAKKRYNRRLIVNHYKKIIGISRKSWKDWKPFSELRSLDNAYRMKIFLEREPETSDEASIDMYYKGIHLSAAMLKSNLQMACKVFTEKKTGKNLNVGYPHVTTIETTSDQPIMYWPLRMPENFVHNGLHIWLTLDAECNLIGVTS